MVINHHRHVLCIYRRWIPWPLWLARLLEHSAPTTVQHDWPATAGCATPTRASSNAAAAPEPAALPARPGLNR